MVEAAQTAIGFLSGRRCVEMDLDQSKETVDPIFGSG
jgi:hypothetical protein